VNAPLVFRHELRTRIRIRTWSDGSQEVLFLGKHGVWNGSWDLLQFEKRELLANTVTHH